VSYIFVSCQAFPGPPQLLFTNSCASTLGSLGDCGRDGTELLQKPRSEHHLCCLYCHGRTAEDALEVYTWLLACPHPVSFVGPVSALEEDVSHSLRSVAALALVGVGLVNGVKVGAEADLSSTHLRDHRANRAVRPDVRVERRFARPHAKDAVFLGHIGS